MPRQFYTTAPANAPAPPDFSQTVRSTLAKGSLKPKVKKKVNEPNLAAKKLAANEAAKKMSKMIGSK